MVAVAIWIIFGIKKFRWAKKLAIILTVLVVIIGAISLIPTLLGRNISHGRPQDRQRLRDSQSRGNASMELNIYDSTIGYAQEIIAI